MEVLRWTGVVLLLTLQLNHIVAHPDGAPREACNDMTPQHGVNPQSDVPPYAINPSARTYCPKNEVNITLVGSPYGMTFKGFLCQARTAVATETPSGSLKVSADSTVVTTNKCTGTASVTHADNSQKKSVQLTWIPDSAKTDSIHIVCTIVQQKSTFWVKENIEIEYAGTEKCTPEGEVRGLPTSCTMSQTCGQAVSNAICDTDADADGACVCPADMKIAHPTHTYCSPKKLGDSCTSDSDCVAVAEAECDNTVTPRVCACKSAFTHNTTDTCFFKGTNVCTTAADCTGTDGSQCVEGKCTSGAMEATVVSLVLVLASFVLLHLISIN